MNIVHSIRWLASVLLAVALVIPQPLRSQGSAPAKPFKKEELAQLLAPIALYPDDLLTSVLVASTYPLEVVQAARWRQEPANAKLKGDALSKALAAKDWDPSVKSLTQVPDVLKNMNEKLEWTQKLGDAFIAQQDDVMEQIQFLRKKAEGTGSLKTTTQQKVTRKENYIVIERANPDVIYVPVYDPQIIYGSWPYPAYTPYYWNMGYPASSFVSGFFWGTGLAVAGSIWGWGHCDWGNRNINIDVNKYNQINHNRTQISSPRWEHDPKHRGPVPYRDAASREKFSKDDAKRRDATKDFRGFDNKAASASDRMAGGPGDRAKGGAGDRAAPKERPGGTPKAGTRPSDTGKRDTPKQVSKPAARPPAKSPAALDVKRGSDVQKVAQRGQASRNAAAARGGGAAARPAPAARGGGGGVRGGRR